MQYGKIKESNIFHNIEKYHGILQAMLKNEWYGRVYPDQIISLKIVYLMPWLSLNSIQFRIDEEVRCIRIGG